MYFCADIGGTNTRIAVVDSNGDINKTAFFKTEKSFINQKNKILENFKIISKDISSVTIAISAAGIAGILTKDRKTLVRSPNLPDYEGKDLNELLGDLKCGKTEFFNDANLAAFGEARVGAGKSYNRVCYLSLGTGVGGSLIENKNPLSLNLTYEPGHTLFNCDAKFSDKMGVFGSTESYISAYGFYRHFGVSTKDCDNPSTWHSYGNLVGKFILSMTLVWNPDVVVVGGGISQKFDNYIEGIKEELKKTRYPFVPAVVKCEYDHGSALVGGIEYIKRIKNG